MKTIMTLAAVGILVGCSQTPSIEGAGFSLLTPAPGTRDYIIKNDVPFAKQVAGNNRTCQRAPACTK